jgi:two-component system, NtrC family, response regulator HydG
MVKTSRILIVDDDQDVLFAIRLLLRPLAKDVVIEKNPEKLLSLLASQKFDCVILDMNYTSSINTGNEGIFWLRKIRQLSPEVPVILITAYGDIDLAVRSVKEGASDFLLKPWKNDKLIDILEETLSKSKSIDRVKNNNSKKDELSDRPIVASQQMKEIVLKIDKIAPTDANILILGEHGTGKSELAKYIHTQSLRRSFPFVQLDLGAMTESLFESELFGYKKGAFTDAKEDRMGRFELAKSGTLFLDEIANINITQQFKLLTVLQERKISRLGSSDIVDIDIRLISATNSNIYELAKENKFRIDLIYRLNTLEITIPPLRNRQEDIISLSTYFAKNYASKYNKTILDINSKAIEKLMHYAYPGNIRELQHIIERAVIMADEDTIFAKDITFSAVEKASVGFDITNAPLNLNTLEKQAIEKVIEKHQGNITKAAQELGLTRSSLYRRLGKHEI